jgi:hypothetical protein
MLENLLEYYRKADGATKKKILGCIFAEKLVLENGRVATSTFTEPIQFIINASEVLGSSKKNKRSILTSCASVYPGRTKVATSLKTLLYKHKIARSPFCLHNSSILNALILQLTNKNQNPFFGKLSISSFSRFILFLFLPELN